MLISKNPAVKTTVDELNRLYNEQAPYALNRAYYGETVRNAETFSLAKNYYNFIAAVEAGKMDAKLSLIHI